ncbi:hypothetical protein EDD86DRAFT_218149 [Gorgonomyces haynaldii]|nr:hypothetical protein EDD86DRAFT_218149 [Gorgonomyces haynaldii]
MTETKKKLVSEPLVNTPLPPKTHLTQFHAAQRYAPTTPSPLSMSPARRALSVRQPTEFTATVFSPAQKRPQPDNQENSEYLELQNMAKQSPFYAETKSMEQDMPEKDEPKEAVSMEQDTQPVVEKRAYKLDDPNSSTPMGTSKAIARTKKKLRPVTPVVKRVVDRAVETEVKSGSKRKAFRPPDSDDEDEHGLPKKMHPDDGWITPQSRKIGKRARMNESDQQLAFQTFERVFCLTSDQQRSTAVFDFKNQGWTLCQL